MKLKADFVKDWNDYLKNLLVNNWGFDISKVDEKDIPFIYFNAELRRIDQRPRRVEVSDVFCCPVEHQTGWNKIQKEIADGDDITPHLSRQVENLGSKDSMLNDWGVYHFHLGDELKGDFIKRTGPLLFALVTEDCLYSIGIYTHDQWTNSNIVEVIHKNWPNVIKKYIVNEAQLVDKLTDDQRKTLRNKNCNAFIQLSDGTAYAPIGGGVTSSGDNFQSAIKIFKQHEFLTELQNHLETQLNNIRPDLERQGYKGEAEVTAKLEITQNEYRAVFSDYAFAVKLHKEY